MLIEVVLIKKRVVIMGEVSVLKSLGRGCSRDSDWVFKGFVIVLVQFLKISTPTRVQYTLMNFSTYLPCYTGITKKSIP